MGKVVLVSSGKGGTGKTMFTVNMGAMLAEKGCSVMLLDMDMGLRNMDLYLGMENRVVYNIMDVMSGICRINKAMIKVSGFESLYFMAASPRRDDRDITPLHMEVLCNKLKRYFDYIIIDCPAGINDLFDVAMAAADKAVVVTEPEVASLRDADVTERYLMEQGMEDIYIVVNKVRADLMRTGMVPNLSEINCNNGSNNYKVGYYNAYKMADILSLVRLYRVIRQFAQLAYELIIYKTYKGIKKIS